MTNYYSGTPEYQDPSQPKRSPEQFVQDTGRWSYHLANRPDWITDDNEAQWKGVYNDPNADPNAAVQQFLNAQRAQGKTDESDAMALTGQGMSGGRGGPSNQSPAQQWNAQPMPQAPVAPSGPVSPGSLGLQQSAETKGRSDELFKLLMERATPQAIDRNSAVVRQQVDPGVAQLDRARRNYISDQAERAGPLGNIEGDRRMAAERFGQGASALESEVIARMYDQQNDNAMASMAMFGNQLSNDQQLELSQQLAALSDRNQAANRDLQRYGMDQDFSISQQGLNQQQQGMGQNYELARRSQDQAMDQFLRELALREYDTNQSWDWRWAMGY